MEALAAAVDERLDALEITDAGHRAAAARWVSSRFKGAALDASVGDLTLVWAALEGRATALAEVDRLIEGLSKRAAGRAIEPAELAQRVRTRLLVAARGAEARLGTYDGRGRFKSWLWTAVKLELLQATRGAGQAPAEELDALTHLATSDPSPEARARSKKDSRLVSKSLQVALEALDAKERTLLRMRFVDGVSTEELGRAFSVHRTTAQRWIEAAQARLLAAMRVHLGREARLEADDVDALVNDVAQSISLRLSQVLKAVPSAQHEPG